MIKIDSGNSRALYNLGRYYEADFNDYNDSYIRETEDVKFSQEKYAEEDFKKAGRLLRRAIECDSLNYDAYLHLGLLYEADGKPEKGIPYLNRLAELSPNDKDAHLYLGLLYYETSHVEEAYREYQKALILMNEEERQDFVYNSVKELLEPVLGKKFKHLSRLQIKQVINYFWKYSDPLYLTNYNERLVEHYSRLAYADLKFGIKDKKKPGWKTDRGEMMLRYGWPEKRIKYRPLIKGDGGGVISVKTDVWYYDNFTLGFTDRFMSGNYVFNEPYDGKHYTSQFAGATDFYVNYLRKAEYTAYKPKFDGPVFKIPFKIVQFKNRQEGNYDFTDVYIDYGMNANDSLHKDICVPYEWGLFFFDLNLNPVHRGRGIASRINKANIIDLPGEKDLYTNSKMMTLWPDSGEFAFEIIRKKDKGVSSNHFLFNVRKFSTAKPDISNLMLAYNIIENDTLPAPVKRGEYSIFPNPESIFYPGLPMYVYYEIYNLPADGKGISSFSQSITITRKETHSGFANTINSFMNIFGMGRKKNQITITSDYKSKNRNPRMYFQLDMNKYRPGEYELAIRIKDNISGDIVESKTEFQWK